MDDSDLCHICKKKNLTNLNDENKRRHLEKCTKKIKPIKNNLTLNSFFTKSSASSASSSNNSSRSNSPNKSM